MRDGYTYINSHLKAAVTMPRLTGVTLSGASRCSASGFNSAEDFVLNVSGVSQATFTALLVNKLTLDISGASRVNGDVDSKGDATLQASGASNIEITGKTVKLIVEESGASTVNLLNFAARDVQVNISGASNATINATGIVSGDISGASRLYYTGTPALGDIHTSGASSISKK
jgi:post-segregation antitoxin (ccd killing protein)